MAKVRRARRRVDPEAELRGWRMTFTTGFDYLHQAAAVGASIDESHRPDLAQARDAWGRLGEMYLQTYARDAPIWALAEFGEPAVAARPVSLATARRRGGRR